MHDTMHADKGFVGVVQVTPPPKPTFWRVSDVAKYYGVARRTVYKWVRYELIPVHRTPGGGLRFVEAEVKAAQVKREE